MNYYGIIKSNKIHFDNQFEEKMTLQYLINIGNSPLVLEMPEQYISIINEIIGQSLIVKESISINNKLAKVVKDGAFSVDDLDHYLTRKDMIYLIRKTLIKALQKRLDTVISKEPDETEKRLNIIKGIFNLTEAEVQAITFFYIAHISPVLDDCFCRNNDLIRLINFHTFGNLIAGMKKRDISKVLNSKKVFDMNLLTSGRFHDSREEFSVHSQVYPASWLVEYLSGSGDREISLDFFSRQNDITLNISDFDIPDDEMQVLHRLIKNNKPFNILFYGESGTGKTSLAKCLAKTFNIELFTVKVPKINQGANTRIPALYATMNFAQSKNSIILIDEADELLNSYDSFFFDSQVNKSWINSFLESHDKKIIWITNMSSSIHPSTMRRFAFTMEFKNFTHTKRIKVIKTELQKRRLEHIFTDNQLDELCRTYSINAGGIINALEVINSKAGKIDKDKAFKMVKTIMRNHEIAINGKRIADNKKKINYSHYTIEGLNCSIDLPPVIDTARRYLQMQNSHNMTDAISLSMLLYGMPGTGKSEFVYYLGYLLNKEVVLRRASDIESPWVGVTEKNISDAFKEAKEEGAILFFDEADSFLYPRRDALRSWEKTRTNEILTQLESHSGIVIFATNDIQGLDHASLRRFRYKIEFMPLKAEGNVIFYKKLLEPLATEPISNEDIKRLKGITNLTPGDFCVVRDQQLLNGTKDISHKDLIDALCNEIRYKSIDKRQIGFRG